MRPLVEHKVNSRRQASNLQSAECLPTYYWELSVKKNLFLQQKARFYLHSDSDSEVSLHWHNVRTLHDVWVNDLLRLVAHIVEDSRHVPKGIRRYRVQNAKNDHSAAAFPYRSL